MFFIKLIVPLFFIGVTTYAAKAVQGKHALQLIKEGFEKFDKTIQLYSKILVEHFPWEDLNKNITKLIEYHKGYSSKTAELHGEVITLLSSGKHDYVLSAQHIGRFCSLPSTLFPYYLMNINDASTLEAHTSPLIRQVFDKGLETMDETQDRLASGISTFNDAAEKLSSLHTRLQNDFYDYLQSKVKQISDKTAPTKVKLDAELKKLDDLKTQLRNAKYILPSNSLRQALNVSAQKLIDRCEHYNRNNKA